MKDDIYELLGFNCLAVDIRLAVMSSHTSPPCRFTVRPPRPQWIFTATVVLVIAGVALKFGTPMYRQQAAIQKIQAIGGKVEHESRLRSLRRLSLRKTAITDAGIERLGSLRALQSLSLDRTNITDAGVQHLEMLTGLESLSLDETIVTGAGLEKLLSLKRLSLRATRITDAELAKFKSLTNLTDLNLWGTKVDIIPHAQLERAMPGLHIRRG